MIDLTNYVDAIKNTDSFKEKKELFSKMIDASKADITTKTKYRTILKYDKTLERKPKPLTNRIVEDLARNIQLMGEGLGVIK